MIVMDGFRKIKAVKNILLNTIIFKCKHVEYGNDLRINGQLYIYGEGKICISDGVILTSDKRTNPISESDRIVFYTKKNAIITIGNNSGLTNSIIIAHEKVEIEDNVLIGANCKIYDTDFHSVNLEERLQLPDPGISCSPVKIGKGAFIGAHSIILKGVTIGKGSVIGAGSVVTKNIPDNEIWGGNPARFLKKL